MKIFKIILACIQILIGIFFLSLAVSDIQLGFGLVLVFSGANLLVK